MVLLIMSDPVCKYVYLLSLTEDEEDVQGSQVSVRSASKDNIKDNTASVSELCHIKVYK